MLEPCLRSIYTSNLSQNLLEVIIVDNSSTDNTVEIVREKFPKVMILQNIENVGFASANNQAMRIAKGRYILLLNPDTLLEANSLKLLLAGIKHYPHAGAVGPRIMSPKGEYQLVSARKLPTPFSTIFRLLWLDRIIPKVAAYCVAYSKIQSDLKVAAISGACTLIPREVLDDIGFLDESLPMGGEDIDWYFRMRNRGYNIYYLAQPRVIHIGGASRVLDISRSDTEEFKSYYYYFLKHFGLRAAYQYRMILGVSMLLRGLFLVGKMIINSPQNRLIRKRSPVTPARRKKKKGPVKMEIVAI